MFKNKTNMVSKDFFYNINSFSKLNISETPNFGRRGFQSFFMSDKGDFIKRRNSGQMLGNIFIKINNMSEPEKNPCTLFAGVIKIACPTYFFLNFALDLG